MPTSNFPKGFSGGVTIQGMPVLMAYATSQRTLGGTEKTGVWWVDSVNGLDGNNGTYQLPLATLGRAWALATANDIIMLKPGHAETISNATAATQLWNVAGVSVIGLGVGAQRPTFTLDTATTSTITVSAANISCQNCVFVANFLNVAVLFTLTTAKGFSLVGNEIRDTSATLNFLNLMGLSTTSNANDGLVVQNNNVFLAATSGVVNFISFLGTVDRVIIQGNYYQAQTTGTGAIFPIATGKAVTSLLVLNNLWNIQNAAGTATGYLITANTAGTGFIHGNFDSALPTTPLQVTAARGFVYGLNYHTDQADLQGYLVPAADA